MAAETPYDRVTENHDEIERWARQRGGEPVETAAGDGPAIGLRFPDDDGGERIDWAVFWERFESAGLAFAYRSDQPPGGFECAIVDGTPPVANAPPIEESVRPDPRPEGRPEERRAEAREAADAANQDAHRDEPPFNS